MKKEIADKFFANVEWFNNFFDNLGILFDKIRGVIQQDLGYTDYDYYYYKYNDQPSIAGYYLMYLQSKSNFHLQLSFILNKNVVKNKEIKVKEPILLIILHNWKNPWASDIHYFIIENRDIKNIKNKDGIISGILDWGRGVKFQAFQMPLDTFEKYDDQIVRDKIVEPIKEILRKNK